MNKFLFIIFSIFTLVHSSIIWTPDELAKYINENYELGATLLFDDKSYITDEHRGKINVMMNRIVNQNDVFVYGIFLDEINLNSYRIDVFFEKVVEALKVPEYVDKKKLIVVSVAFTNQQFSLRVGEIENKNLNNNDAAKIVNNGLKSFSRLNYSKGVYEIFEALEQFYFSFPTMYFLLLILVWIIIFLIAGLKFRNKYKDIKKLPFFLYTKEERKLYDTYYNFFQALRDNPNMIDTHCLICFKPLQENKSKETNNGIQSNLISDKNITVCDFKHALHYECIQRWQNASQLNDCPICLEEISRQDFSNYAVSLKEKILAIQHDFYPDVEKFYNLANNDYWYEWVNNIIKNERIMYKLPKLREIEEQRNKEEEEKKRKREEETKRIMEDIKKREEERKAEEEKRKNDPNYIPPTTTTTTTNPTSTTSYSSTKLSSNQNTNSNSSQRSALDILLTPNNNHRHHHHPLRHPPQKSHKSGFSFKFGGFGGKKSGGAFGGW